MSIQGNLKAVRRVAEPLQVAMENGAKRALIPINMPDQTPTAYTIVPWVRRGLASLITALPITNYITGQTLKRCVGISVGNVAAYPEFRNGLMPRGE